jgi:hypothetical protein
MKEIDEDLIYNQFEGCSLKMMKKIFSKLIKRKEKDEKKQSKVREDKFNAAVKELLDLCPQVDMIPVGISYQYHEDCYNTNDEEELFDALDTKYFNDKNIPQEYDDMSIGTYKQMNKLWRIIIKNSPIVYEEFDGDYCQFCHISVFYYDRKEQKVLETPEL